MHVEVKLMQTGQHMELPVVFSQPFPSASPMKGFWTGAQPVSLTPAHRSTSENTAVLMSSASPSALLRPVILVTKSGPFYPAAWWLVLGLQKNGLCPAALISAQDGTVSGDPWWSTLLLSVSSQAGPAWPGFPSEVWSQDSEVGLAGSTFWLLHSLP